jgi:hypothetical protein
MKVKELFEAADDGELTDEQETWIYRVISSGGYNMNHGRVDIGGTVHLSKNYNAPPVKLNIVTGNFICHGLNITSLTNFPEHIVGDFECNDNNLISLKDGPTFVGGTYNCGGNKKITSLDHVARDIGKSFSIMNTNITSLHNIHKHIDSIGQTFYINARVTDSVLGLLKIKDIVDVFILGQQHEVTDLKQVVKILNKHLQGDRNIFDCQSELIDAGLDDYAKL